MSGSVTDEGRGVSDVVGFAIVFAVVVLSISLVYTVGVGALTDVQEAEAVDNVGAAFDILADNMADIHRNGAPGRSTELEFESGTVATTGRMTLSVTGPGLNESFAATPIRYVRDESGFHYATGAVIRTTRGESVMVQEPPFRFTEDRAVISFVETKPVGPTGAIGGGTLRVAARSEGTAVAAIRTGGVTFNVSVTSPRYRAWERYFERTSPALQWCVTEPANTTVVCRFASEQLYVRRTLIRVELAR